ncbi:TetR/AcrR family transcriptional regulator [Rhizobium sp. AAP43]|uniref:TetR/AcrR family transcriptional regulator n=1 Tax=Rhizobium sp. AAP43 TaxID=1523420 RepID=UPI0006B96459|nr:TetR/AcrR family transcriptional regulator [Rhizobium sp. AAP43]KPF42256.1 transcriptional regulator [Rhizobium sp. AAP43]
MAVEHRTKKGEDRIRALKEAATDMFLVEGYEAVSVDGLIARVGGSRRNVYDHFGGKEGLFVEAITALCEELGEPLRLLQVEGRDPQNALTLFGRKIVEIALQPRTLALHRLMIAEGRRFPSLAQSIWHAGHMNAQRILTGWIEDGQKAGLLRPDIEAAQLAADFISLTTADVQLKALIGLKLPSPSDIDAIVRHAVSVFLIGAFQTYHGSKNV